MRWWWATVAALGLALVALAPMAAAEPAPGSSLPAAAKPSSQAIAFYYGWYGNPRHDGEWVHWNDERLGIVPPTDISSDFYPQLGAYSSRDPAVLRQHMAWLKRANIGVIALSWWAGETSDAFVTQVLDAAQKAGIKVTLHIEPVSGRTARNYQANVIRLVKRFGSHPAFFTTTKGSLYQDGGKARPLIFVWATGVKDLNDAEAVKPSYWANANDAIRRQVGALILACPCGGGYDVAVTEGRFDGAYNYATLHLDEQGGFDWARSLPPGAIYVPSVLPGFQADRLGYDKDTIVLRREGQEYDDQWTSALGAGVTPDFVSITSFNEWHEGSQIEPSRAEYSAGGRRYLDFLPLSPTSYLDQTARWVTRYVTGNYPRPASTPVRLTITTSSDWLMLDVTQGALARPLRVRKSAEATRANFNGTTFAMNQPLGRAEAGLAVSMTYEAVALGDSITIRGTSGFIGQTTVTVAVRSGATWQQLGEAVWIGGADDGESRTIALP